MRAFFWILMLVNVVFFATMKWGTVLFAGEGMVHAQPPLHEEKISLVSAQPARPPLPASAPLHVPASVDVPAPLATGQDVSCMEWGEFSGSDLVRATTALSALQLGDRLQSREVEYAIGYWVYIPPQKDKAAVSQKIAQLKARGVEEYFVVTDAGPWLNAISLGVFRAQEAAQHFLGELQRTKDIRSARVGERASKLKATVFMLNGLDGKAVASLAEMQKDFAGSELKNVACAH